MGKALTGAWFEVVELMNAEKRHRQAALEHMAKASGTDLAGFQAQLDTTKLFATPQGSPGVLHQQATAGNHAQGRRVFLPARLAR